jgi:hypothetical protein
MAENSGRYRRILKNAAIAYVPASYLYWITIGWIGNLLYPSFSLSSQVPFVHGSFSIALLIIFSPIWLPFNLMLSFSWQTISYVEENLDASPMNCLCEWLAFICAFSICYLFVYLCSRGWRAKQTHVDETGNG